MQAVVLIFHLVISVALIGLVLLQRSEGGALGIGGGSGALMSGRGAADTLARMTSFAGGFFLVTSLLLTYMSGAAHQSAGRSVLDLIPHSAPATHPAATPPPAQTPAQPTTPDPTQSSAPQAAPANQLASIDAGSAAAATPVVVAPPPTAAALHAGPTSSPTVATPNQGATTRPASANVARPLPNGSVPATTPRTTPVSTSTTASAPPATAPARTQTASAQVPTATTGTNPAPVRTNPPRQAAATTTATQAPLIGLPGDSLTDAESSQTPPGVEVVRRTRAGPDQ